MLRMAGLFSLVMACSGCSLLFNEDTKLSDREYEQATSLITPSLVTQCDRASKGLFPGANLKRVENSEGRFAPSDYSKKISLSHALHLSYRTTLTYPGGNQIVGNLVCRFTYNKSSDSISFSGVFFE